MKEIENRLDQIAEAKQAAQAKGSQSEPGKKAG